MHGANWSWMSLGRPLSIKKGGAKVAKQWAECYNHTGYLGTLGKVEGDLCELLISVGLYVAWRFQMKLPDHVGVLY